MRFLIILTFLFSTTAFAEVSRDEASGIIDEMVSKQMISAEEGEKAKIRLRSMNPSEWTALNQDAEVKAARMPASVPESGEAASGSSDLSQEQFQTIQNDLAVIAPHYNQ
ncbi:MAG: hypothetical protein V4598_03640 [Bdellovibrionota bacterium]